MQNMSWDTACRGIYWYYVSIKMAAVRHTPTFGLKSFLISYLAYGIIAFSSSSFPLLSHFFVYQSRPPSEPGN